MDLEFRRFQKEYYSEYASWFTDPELNRQLGPMDLAWLDAVISEPESAGTTWAVFHRTELVAVVETVFDPKDHSSATITAIATKPSLQRQGIGKAVLQLILLQHKNMGISEHIAYISKDNVAGQRCAEKVGFVLATTEPNEHGYLTFRHRQ